MTAPDPRLGEIAARLSAAPGVHGMYSFHGSDVALLLAALADRDAKLARVEAEVSMWEREDEDHLNTVGQHLPCSIAIPAERIRAAVADTTGGGEK